MFLRETAFYLFKVSCYTCEISVFVISLLGFVFISYESKKLVVAFPCFHYLGPRLRAYTFFLGTIFRVSAYIWVAERPRPLET